MTEKKQQPHQDDKDHSPGGELPPLAHHRSCITAKGSKNEGCEFQLGAIDERKEHLFLKGLIRPEAAPLSIALRLSTPFLHLAQKILDLLEFVAITGPVSLAQ